MYIVNVPIQIKEGFKEQFVAGIKENASHAQNDEPGCLQFNVIQDVNDINRVWVYEVLSRTRTLSRLINNRLII